jgi:hypothetical protein
VSVSSQKHGADLQEGVRLSNASKHTRVPDFPGLQA